jgi:hypothetical protein
VSAPEPYTPRDALASTGPRTVEGKAKASRNAMKHGLTAKLVVTPDERTQDFDDFGADLVESLEPVGALEAQLVERVILCAWRARRVARLEASLFTFQRENSERFEILNEGHSPAAQPWRDVGSGSVDALVTLGRYETALERSLYKALHELERVQARRRGESVALPAVLDVAVSADAGA